MAKGKYDSTLNLPQTEFPMRANLPKREPEILKFWQDIDVYKLVQEKNQGREKFILHDGPPYANGHIHLGHTLNKVLKDMIVKHRSMAGFDSPYVPGWDTHGLPIEQQAIKHLGIDRHKTDVLEFRHFCRDYALKFVDIQRQEFERLGVRGDWDNPYLTLKPEFEGIQIKVFGDMANKGYIYKGMKPVYWCADCETALAEAEIEYHDKVSPSIYVKFPVTEGKGIIPDGSAIIIWTTTPWTLPANVAVCLHPEFTYVVVKVKDQKYVLAKELLDNVAAQLGWSDYQIVTEFTGQQIDRAVCRHPFIDRDSLVIMGEHVTLEAGTGCVHTAPGHGEDDFYVGKIYGLEVISPVDDRGVFTDEAGQFAGLYVHKANQKIIAAMDELGVLLKADDYSHQYPHCWRCKNPIVYRATNQWFASIDGFRHATLEAIDNVRWIPSWGRERIYNMVRDRGDWCISRQRTWGVPIPIFYCGECGEPVINPDIINHVSDLFCKFGSDIWFAKPAQDLLPEGFTCPSCSSQTFTKETDIMDVWFDSGSSHMAVLETYPELRWPADMYLEGSDQHRGWFNSSLSTAVAVRGVAPYRQVLTHGFIVDEKGYKMSKSSGNVVDPLEMIEEMGADILRLWVASADYRNDISVSKNIIKQASEAYRKIRNTCRFILGNLYDFDPARDAVPYDQLSELDRWALLKLDKVVRRVSEAFDDYEFHVVFHTVHNFCTVDLSNIYFDILKDKLYCNRADDPARRSAQTVLHQLINTLVAILAPILAFTSEEIWGYLKGEGMPASVQMLEWPPSNDMYRDDTLESTIDKILSLREVVTKALEEARVKKVIGHSLGARVVIYAEPDWQPLLADHERLKDMFIVSQVDVAAAEARDEDAVALDGVTGAWVKVHPADGTKCERCWIIDLSVGKDEQHSTLCTRCAAVVKSLED
ncbi:MAG TPA: isoleucine--tRNA ligase [Syntrophomonadaceae bacterium]|jgi:isoleucyl-tRNA synthetase|nr:isoleucine--tRNA ligase [Syntrophomonadaceae bacterium]